MHAKDTRATLRNAALVILSMYSYVGTLIQIAFSEHSKTMDEFFKAIYYLTNHYSLVLTENAFRN